MRELKLPESSGAPAGRSSVHAEGSIVIIGANGAGKTRLGSWIELSSPQTKSVHRIAAQKSLMVPEASPTSAPDIAEAALLYGYANKDASVSHKTGHKWGQKPNTFLQNDYDKLLTYLFTEEFDKSTLFRQQMKAGEQAPPPETKLDVIKRIWEEVLPHRELIIGGGKIEARPKSGAAKYSASEMSDGERVIFYLVGHALAAKADSIIVIDEPELHLHKALQTRLWNAVEAERPDCLFIYLTHDLDFAASRSRAKKIWIKAYENGQWEWYELPDDHAMPERILLEILGSRKPVLFCEGERDSLDHSLLTYAYSDYSVTPCGSCEAVIHSTRSFRNLAHLHALVCVGVVDRDYRSGEEVAYLNDLGIHALPFSEIENVLLTDQVVSVVLEHQKRADGAVVLRAVQAMVFDELRKERDRVASRIAASRISSRLRRVALGAVGGDELAAEFEEKIGVINATDEFSKAAEEVDRVLTQADYTSALRLYDNKGLLPRASVILGFVSGEFVKLVKRLLGSKDNAAIVAALQSVLPKLENAPAPRDVTLDDQRIEA